jgi:hypothetical protein
VGYFISQQYINEVDSNYLYLIDGATETQGDQQLAKVHPSAIVRAGSDPATLSRVPWLFMEPTLSQLVNSSLLQRLSVNLPFYAENPRELGNPRKILNYP